MVKAEPAEATIFGIRNFEDVRETIMVMVRGYKPVAVESATEYKRPGDVNIKILEDLKQISKALQK